MKKINLKESKLLLGQRVMMIFLNEKTKDSWKQQIIVRVTVQNVSPLNLFICTLQ